MPTGLIAVIDDRRHVADQLVELAGRLEALSAWTKAPGEPFPADAVELGQFIGRVAVLLLAGGGVAGDGRLVRTSARDGADSGGLREDGSADVCPVQRANEAARPAMRYGTRGLVVTALAWGLLALAVVFVLWLIYRTVDADSRACAEVARIVRADVERLIEDNPVSEWAPGAEPFSDPTTARHIPFDSTVSSDRWSSR